MSAIHLYTDAAPQYCATALGYEAHGWTRRDEASHRGALSFAFGLTFARYTLNMPYRTIGARMSSDSKALKPLACCV